MQAPIGPHEEFRGDDLFPNGLQQKEQRSGFGKEAAHQFVVALVDGRVRSDVAAVEAQYLKVVRPRSTKPLDGLFQTFEVLIGECVGGAQSMVAEYRLEVRHQDRIAGAVSQEDAAGLVTLGRHSMKRGEDLQRNTAGHAALEAHDRRYRNLRLGHGRRRV
jgi:hypothetical protein